MRFYTPTEYRNTETYSEPFQTSKIDHFAKKHYTKSVQIRIFFWSVFSCTRTEYRKIRTRKNSVFGHFSRSDSLVDFKVVRLLIERAHLKNQFKRLDDFLLRISNAKQICLCFNKHHKYLRMYQKLKVPRQESPIIL